jgi:transketolase
MRLMDPRKVFAQTLMDIGTKQQKVIAVSCDSSSGGGLTDFISAFPERFVECGIAEQNATSVSAALSKQGFIPVLVAITPFITMRNYEQIRDDIGYANSNVKIVGSGGGLQYSTLGSTHEALEDIALMRTIPNMVVFTPGDGYEVEAALRLAVEHDGPVYIRMPRHKLEDIAPYEQRKYEIGSLEKIVCGGSVTVFAIGTMVSQCIKAAEILKEKGINISVVDVATVKPLSGAAVKAMIFDSKFVITVEEHNISGGLGTSIIQAIAEFAGNPPVYTIGVKESSILVCGPYEEVLDFYGLSSTKIADFVMGKYN